MTLQEYFAQVTVLISEVGVGLSSMVAAEIAAGYEAGLSIEQMQRFVSRRLEISSVAMALKGVTLSVDAIQRILDARQAGAVLPNEILVRAFSPEEVDEEFSAVVFAASPGS